MATFPSPGQTNWGPMIQEYVDEGVTTAIDASIRTTYEALDIWPEYNSSGNNPDSWLGDTYANYISGFDASLATELGNGDVTKETLGADEGGEPIYCYEAGTGPVDVFILAGQHTTETVGMFASMRWFQVFAQSDHPLMRKLRDAFRVTYIPVALPSQFRIQKDKPNGVNINRNWDFFWTTYAANPSYPPGSAAFSEVETQLVRDKFLTKPYAIALDCHNYSSSATEDIKYVPPSEWLLGNRTFLSAVADDWARIYAGGDRSRIVTMYPRGTDPMFSNWANYVMRHQNKRQDAVATTIESPSDLRSGTSARVSREGMQAYCGYMTQVLVRWFENGTSLIDRPYGYETMVYKRNVSPANLDAPLADGGGLIDGTVREVRFDAQTPLPGVLALPGVDRLSLIPPYAPAHVVITAVAEIAGKGTAGRVLLQLAINGSADSWGTANADIGTTSDSRHNLTLRSEHRITTRDAATITNIQLRASMSGGGTATLRRCSLHAHVSPDVEETTPTPLVTPGIS